MPCYMSYSMTQSLYLSTSDFVTTLRIKSLNTSRNVSVTANPLRTPARRNSRPAQTKTNVIHQQTVLRVKMLPLAQNGKTYQPKTSLEAQKTSTTELSDAKTHARAQKLWQRAPAPRAQGHQSYSKACRTKHKTDCRTRCKRHYGGYPLRMSYPSVSRRQRRAS